MIPGPDAARRRSALRAWWAVWAAILAALGALYLVLGRGPLPAPDSLPPEKSLTGLIGVVPLFVSIVIRWLVLPRYREPKGAFVMFVAGLALAEACGILGIFLGGPYRDDLFLLGLLGIGQFVPFFARAYFDPKPVGYIPNN
jgi:hypothetical protein